MVSLRIWWKYKWDGKFWRNNEDTGKVRWQSLNFTEHSFVADIKGGDQRHDKFAAACYCRRESSCLLLQLLQLQAPSLPSQEGTAGRQAGREQQADRQASRGSITEGGCRQGGGVNTTLQGPPPLLPSPAREKDVLIPWIQPGPPPPLNSFPIHNSPSILTSGNIVQYGPASKTMKLFQTHTP